MAPLTTVGSEVLEVGPPLLILLITESNQAYQNGAVGTVTRLPPSQPVLLIRIRILFTDPDPLNVKFLHTQNYFNKKVLN